MISRYDDVLRTERGVIEYIETELEKDQKLLRSVTEKYPIVGGVISKLRWENEELKNRIQQLEKEVLNLQHQRILFHDLGQ